MGNGGIPPCISLPPEAVLTLGETDKCMPEPGIEPRLPGHFACSLVKILI